MKALKAVAIGIVTIKLLIAIPLTHYGALIGVIGIGPDGRVPLEWRLIGLCVLVGGLGIGCPFSLIGPARRFPLTIVPDWVIASFSLIPVALFTYLMLHWPPSPPDDQPRPWVYIVGAALCAILAFADLIAARVLSASRTDKLG